MLGDPLQRESRIFRRLMQTRREIVEAARKPRIMLAQTIHSQRDQVAREQFSQRRGHRFQESPVLDQIEISIDGIANRRQYLIAAA